VGDVTLTPQQNDSDRIATLYHHVVELGHTVQITPQSDSYVQIECISDNGTSTPCGEDHEAWWDHWDFSESYVAHIQEQLKAAEEVNHGQ
jgi:hypothetical protein